MNADACGSSKADTAYVRPDPARGQLGDARYAQHWALSHDNVDDVTAYRAGYADLLTLEALLPSGYRLLDVGCGTAGYHRLLARHGRLHGIDPIPEMIEAAKRFKSKFDLANATYDCHTFESFTTDERFDAIRLVGTFGWYVSWHSRQEVLRKAHNLLDPGGIVVLSYVPPVSLAQWAKALFLPKRTVVIPQRRFVRMLQEAGFVTLFELRLDHASLMFARRDKDVA